MRNQRVTGGLQTGLAIQTTKNPAGAETPNGAVEVVPTVTDERANDHAFALKTQLQKRSMHPTIIDFYDRGIPFALRPVVVRLGGEPRFNVGLIVGRRCVARVGGSDDYCRTLDLCRLIARHVPGVEVRL